MRRTGWTDTIIILASGFAVLLVSMLMMCLGDEYLVYQTLSIITPLVALFLGIIGLKIYAGRSEVRNDRLNILNLWLSVGLIMFSLAEITSTLARLTQNTQQMILMMLLIQIPGILLWGLGIIQYLNSLNDVIKISNSGKIWIVLAIMTGASSIGLALVMSYFLPLSYLIERIILSPILVGLLLFSIISLGLVWIFRNGLLSRPLFFIFSSFSLLTVRIVFWIVTDFQVNTLVDILIAFEVYIMCGATLLLSRDLDRLNK